VISIARRLKVDVSVVSRGSRGLDWSIPVLLGELLQSVVRLLADQVSLFHPAFDAARGAYLHESPLAIQYFHSFSVFHDANFGVNRSHLIAKISLRSRDVVDFQGFAAASSATRNQKQSSSAEKCESTGRNSEGGLFHEVNNAVLR
jgi:hypothetical protein